MVLIMLINGTLKSFEMPYVLTNGGPGTSTEMMATYMYKTAFSKKLLLFIFSVIFTKTRQFRNRFQLQNCPLYANSTVKEVFRF